jgi:glucose/arabinose dehydrogenase
MKRIVLFLSILVLLLTLGVSGGAGDPSKGGSKGRSKTIEKFKASLEAKIQEQGRSRVLVKVKLPEEPLAQLAGEEVRDPWLEELRAAAIQRLQDELERGMGKALTKGERFGTIPYVALEVDALELQRLSELPVVASIQEDRVFEPLLNNSVPQIGGDLAWSAGYTGAGEVIAVLDSGVDSSHSALVGKVVDEACFSTNNALEGAVSLCPNGAEEQVGAGAAINCDDILGCDHGTHVAGIAAADDSQYAGVARDAELMAIQVFSRIDNLFACGFFPPCLAAYESDVIRGLEYVYEQRDNFNIAAVNMSLGGESYTSPQACDDDNAALKAAIDNLRAVDIATVVASGNDGFEDAISSPACISSAISVGAVTGSDGVAYFSNSASWLKSLAPGTSITSAIPGGGFLSKDGTSMAAPHVAGAVAVLNSVVPDAAVDEIEEALTSAGVLITDARNGVVVPRVQVDAAAQALSDLYDITNIDLALEQVVTGLNRPIAVTHAADGSGRLFIGQQPGQIMIYDGTEILSTPFLDIAPLVFPFAPGEREGLLSVAFHPQYATNGFFYVSYIDNARDMLIARYSVSAYDANVADGGSEFVLLTIPAPPGDHYGGQLAFGSDGYLYVGVGDGGEDGVAADTARDLETLLGKVLRIDVDGGTPYAIPPDNPFVSDPQAEDEIWALGLRNPWRFSFDRLTGDLYIADVGEASYEEVNFQSASSAGGEDYGWNVMEGANCYQGAACDPTGLVLPLAAYDHSEGCAITGGYVYRGEKYMMLRGVYLYADFCSGRIWGLKRSGPEWQSALLLDTAPAGISTFGDDEVGNVYLANHATGDIYLVKTVISVQTTQLPQGQVGEAYTTTLRASGGKRPYTWSISAGSLPNGLTLDPDTGIISGVPTTYGLSTFTILVEDSNLESATQVLTMTINPPPLAIQTESLPDGPVNQSYSQNLQANGGKPPYTWRITSGGLPPGLSLTPDGTITGTPPVQGYYPFAVRVTDTDSVTDTRQLSIAVVGPSGTIEIALEVGVINTGEYGYNYGSSQHETQLIATFQGTTMNLVFSVTGYDIDSGANEVVVYLNDVLLGSLSQGPDNGLNSGDSFTISASAQVSGENRIRFVQQTAGYTWGVTNLLLAEDTGSSTGPPEVALTVGVMDTGEYGYNYGSSEHEKELIATFGGTTMDLVLSVTGYDIDSGANEVLVYLNGVLLGNLSQGPDNGLNSGDNFPILASAQLSGENRIKFAQQTAGYTWGVTNLLLAEDTGSSSGSPEVALTVGVMDTGEYGYNYGSSEHEKELIATFAGTTVDLVLSVTGYDIDSGANEVLVYLNGGLLGNLSQGPDNGLNSGDNFSIPASVQLSGENRIKFVQQTAGYTWGVTNLLVGEEAATPMDPVDVTLTVGVMDTGEYGYNYGSTQYEKELVVGFDGTTMDLVFSVTGYDIDDGDEVKVYLNDVLLGYLSKGPDNGLNSGDIFPIPASDQLTGENRIKFVQKVAGWKWGVTNLFVGEEAVTPSDPVDVTLTVGVMDTGAYGYNYGTTQYDKEFVVGFEGTTLDLVLSVTGYDIDSSNEVTVYLNDVLLGSLSQGPDNGVNSGDSFSIPASDQLTGENRIKFVQQTAGYTWGVTNLLLAEDTGGSTGPPEVALTVGVMDTGAYGYNYGSSEHEKELIATFTGTTLDLVFSVTGYDIDSGSNEVTVYLNDVLLGNLSQGPDNGLNSGDSFSIPASVQLTGENRIKFVQQVAGYTWGVTNLLLAEDTGPPMDPADLTLTVGVMDTGEYGYNYGSTQYQKEFLVGFVGTTLDLVFSVTGYDIDDGDEVKVYLNDVLLGYLSKGADNGLNSGDGFAIPASAQLTGENRIKFVQKVAGWKWGVTNLLLAEDTGPPMDPADLTLTVGVMDTGEYGYNYGSTQYQKEFLVGFVGTTLDLVFSVTGYDIDDGTEVKVYLNDVLLGNLSKGADNGLNSGDSFAIPASAQLTGENRIKFVQKVAGWKWGVTNLLLAEGS